MLPLWSLNGSTNVAAGLPVPFNAFDFSDPNDSCQHSGDASADVATLRCVVEINDPRADFGLANKWGPRCNQIRTCAADAGHRSDKADNRRDATVFEPTTGSWTKKRRPDGARA